MAQIRAFPPLAGRLALRLPQGDVRCGVAPRLPQAVPRPLRKEGDVREHAAPERIPRLREDLPSLRDVDAILPGRIDVRRRAVEDVLGPGVLPLLLRLLDRLRTQRPDLAVISEGERLSGVREEGLRVRDVAPALLRVPDLRARFVKQGLEDPFAALVERPRRDAPQESLGRDEVAPRGERLRLF